MLTADLVRARIKGDDLVVTSLTSRSQQRAREMAEAALCLAASHVGKMRDELETAWEGLPRSAQEQRLFAGILKTIEDVCEFDPDTGGDPVAIRHALFAEAQERRNRLGPGEAFPRDDVVASVARDLGLSPGDVERGMYADLRGAHELRGVRQLSADEVVSRYEVGQLQGVLLRAAEVRADIWCRRPSGYRRLFAKLKFLRLLYELEPAPDGHGIRLRIDGPLSLFESVTKYGLGLALALPSLLESDRLSLTAEVRWGRDRRRATFRLEREGPAGADSSPASDQPEVTELLAAIAERPGPWKAEPSGEVLEVRGVGLCVPDVVFTHRETGEVIYFEVLGYWSRDAVWRRVELVQRGLGDRVLFAVNRRLRVSEEVLGDDEPSALYVYRGQLSRAAIERKLEAMSSRRR